MRARLAGASALMIAPVSQVLPSAPAPVPPAAPGTLAAAVVPAAAAASPARPVRTRAGTYRVRLGDTLSGISARFCGTAAAWPSLAAASRIADADLIYPGQRVVLSCHGAPAVARALAAPRARHDRFDGRHGRCGDGDGDGMDANCAVIFPGTRAHAHVPAHAAATPRAVTHYGDYGFSGLEQLWLAAGGPGWAAFSAATIAMCESGGNPRAYNPSGASGLWQILGLPFPGDPFNPGTNARMAVAKFRGAGDSFSPWVCKG